MIWLRPPVGHIRMDSFPDLYSSEAFQMRGIAIVVIFKFIKLFFVPDYCALTARHLNAVLVLMTRPVSGALKVRHYILPLERGKHLGSVINVNLSHLISGFCEQPVLEHSLRTHLGKRLLMQHFIDLADKEPCYIDKMGAEIPMRTIACHTLPKPPCHRDMDPQIILRPYSPGDISRRCSFLDKLLREAKRGNPGS